MPVFLRLTTADINDPAFWARLDITRNSTIDARSINDRFQITLTANSISFADTRSGAVTTYTDADINSGSFGEFVQVRGNDADNDVSGSVGLNASGYVGGSGDDTLTDDGSLGGSIDGGRGDDILQGGSGNNNIDGGTGDDVLRGGSGNNNILRGGNGDDTLYAEDGGGNLEGGRGDDVIFAGLNTTFVQGGNGDDSLTVPVGSTVNPFSRTGGNVTLPNGRTFTYLNINTVAVACFTAGTPLRTPRGEVPVDRLAVGDLVETLDHGPRSIRWIGRRTVPGRGAQTPVTFLPGTIGNREVLRVSPQHRVLLSGWKCELLFDVPQVLCAAKHLCDGDRIFTAPCDAVTYFHVMFDAHEVVFAHGALLESFYAGDHILDADRETHAEIMALFPELAATRLPRAARPIVKAFEARTLLPLD
ncbi:Hint domain-containing protein [Roseobacter sinensis]|uniref:Hint domain-containing protein n=1 Tax=Roseobacter sinensis TaxID=2931391 RepID=A0ABT3BGH2_9RHOB|nr:Hint domain-containing protein [Roseobacter sp. WL0113]MCV3272677.1 Hint domain-containing protein [Roseobacter sp. WL0113]